MRLPPSSAVSALVFVRHAQNNSHTSSRVTELTQEPGSFASSTVLNGFDDGPFVPPFARSHGPSSSYGSVRSLRPLILPSRDASQRISVDQSVPESMRNSTASDDPGGLEGRGSPSSLPRRTFLAPNGRFNGPVGLPPRPRLATAGRDLLTPVAESPS